MYNLRIMIYVDMDGVLANLYDYMTLRMFQKTFINISSEEKDMLKSTFRNKEAFDKFFPEGPEKMFEDLEPYPFNQTLIGVVKDFANEYTILSRPSALDVEGTKRAKRKWVERHLSFCPPKEVLLVQDKTANGRAPGNILIDDYDSFLTKWTEEKGHSIEFKAWTFNSLDHVKIYLETVLKDK